ncbi:hypothetical protein PBY51_018170 [Eleginops maclovinus]|uniref:Uncharacterized protein n=1 Tax=Eleginops maclovinus TaxID=56733 RepID=A0AAN7XN55_ELEMC|nr:hypothetical protein PBY51_018170 [Eleginops maclovinus]
MAWRMWSKLCCGQKWLLLLFPFFLLFLAIFVMAMTLPRPLPCTDLDWRSSRALSSTGRSDPGPESWSHLQFLPTSSNSVTGPGNPLQKTHLKIQCKLGKLLVRTETT